MIPTSSRTLRNSLSAIVPTPVKNYLVTKVFFSPTVGRVLRLVDPEKTLKGLANLVNTKKVNYFGIEASPRLAREAEINIRNNDRWDSAVRIENLCIEELGFELLERFRNVFAFRRCEPTATRQ